MSRYSAFRTLVPVRPDDIDMNRHVHNSKYSDYVLAARYDQMERCYGMSMEAFIERGLGWVVRASYIEHKRALVLGDVAVVETRIAEIGRHGVKVDFDISRESDAKTAARGWFDYTLVCLEKGRPRAIPEDVVAIYSV
jgi:YbgC/YbaW family acyl-CoA thioester hydrolase